MIIIRNKRIQNKKLYKKKYKRLIIMNANKCIKCYKMILMFKIKIGNLYMIKNIKMIFIIYKYRYIENLIIILFI